jgi:hypothetical protein
MHIDIRIQSADIIPPPFSYQAQLRLDIEQGQLQAHLQLIYTDRDEVDLEDILDEGFTENDDFDWKGTLQAAWIPSIEKIVKETRLNQEEVDETTDFVEVTIDSETGTPENLESWRYFYQELTQVVFETAQKEAPLRIQYRKMSEQDTKGWQLEMSFETRKATILPPAGQPQELGWEEGGGLIALLFMGEFDPDEADTREPKKKGMYVETGDGLWYKLGHSLRNPHGNRSFLAELERTFGQYLK